MVVEYFYQKDTFWLVWVSLARLPPAWLPLPCPDLYRDKWETSRALSPNNAIYSAVSWQFTALYLLWCKWGLHNEIYL